METVPHEILAAIADALPPTTNLPYFCLVSRRFSALDRKIFFLDTLESMHRLETLSQLPYYALHCRYGLEPCTISIIK